MITREQAIALTYRDTLYHVRLRNADGSALRARVNGQVKTWKRDAKRFSVPMKHGLRDCFYLTPENASEWDMVDPTEAERAQKLREKQTKNLATITGLSEDTPLPIMHDKLLDMGKDNLATLVAVMIKHPL